MTLSAHLPALQIAVPLFGAILCALLRHGLLAWLISLIASWLMPVISFMLLFQVQEQGAISYAMGGWKPPFGIEYRVDLISAYILVLISLVGAVTMPYARKSVGAEISANKQSWFYTMYLLCLAGLLGIAITGDAFNAFVFLEISSLSTYVLIALGKDRRALVAAYQYLIMGTIGATFYVIGIGLLYTVTGSLNFVDISARIAEIETIRPLLAALAFIIVGISLKLALFPLHLWLPNAYAYAPSFATVFLAATATKVAVYLMLRILFSIFGLKFVFKDLPITEIFLALSLAAMFGASIVAVFQENIKRMLAYSSVAQIGYITLGIALANQSGLTGGIIHLFNHAVMKAALFLAMGAVFYRISSVKIEDMAGIGRHMPITMGVFAIAGLGLIGVPGTAGFISKWYLAVGALEEGWLWLVMLLVASSVISVIYVGRVIEVVWLRPASGATIAAKDPPLEMLIPMVLLGAATVYFGFDTSMTSDISSKAAAFLLGGAR